MDYCKEIDKKIEDKYKKLFYQAFGKEYVDVEITRRFSRIQGSINAKINGRFFYKESFKDFYAVDNIQITVYYPKITISNHHGFSHEIKDLYIQITFHRNTPSSTLKGIRATLTEEECASSYSHSHLFGRTSTSFTNFCTEGSTDLRRSISILNSSLDNLSLADVLLFKGNLDAYLAWESLDGGPYCLFQNIGVNEELEKDTTHFSLHYVKEIISHINQFYKPDLKFSTSLEIKNKEELSEKIGQQIKEGKIYAPYVFKIGSTYYKQEGRALYPEDFKEEIELFTFKEKEVFRKIIPSKKRVDHIFYLHPEILHFYCEYWENKMKEFVCSKTMNTDIVEKLKTKTLN